MRERIVKIKKKIEPYLRHWSSAALLFGFVFDSLTLTRVDLFWGNVALASYLMLAVFGFIFASWQEAGKIRFRGAEKLRVWLLLLAQFALGNLFSGFMVFYSHSGVWLASWPFLLFLLVILIANETLKQYYARLIFRFYLLFIGLYFFLIFHLPIVLAKMGDGIFLLSGGASLILITLYILGLGLTVPQQIKSNLKTIAAGVLAIFFLVNLFYFTNILPPIPLSLKDAGVYHSVKRVGDNYQIATEPGPWYQFLTRQTIHFSSGETIYAYSAVFAPTRLHTAIIHEWQFYNAKIERWQTRSQVSLPISGGRDGGYRGYSLASNLETGWWRVLIKTERGQTIGRLKFWAEKVDAPPMLKTIQR